MDYATTYDNETKIWSGPDERPFYDFNCSIGRVMYEQMRNMPRKIFQISDIDGRVVTNEEALTWAIRIAQHLKQLALGHKEIVGIIGKNTTYLMPLAVGCLMNATPFHAINGGNEESLINHMLSITKPKIIFCDGSVFEKVFNATKAWNPMLFTLNEHLEHVRKVEDLLEPTETESNFVPELLVEGGSQTMAILCSSGTTGLPKAVCITNKDLFYNCRVNGEDVLFSMIGIDWVSGLCMLTTSATKGCTQILTSKPFTPQYFAELVYKYKITYFTASPSIVTMLLANVNVIGSKLKSVRLVLCGGSYISAKALINLQELIGGNGEIAQSYGLTEFGLVTANYTKANLTSPGFLGVGMRARVVDDNGQNLEVNQIGELHLHIGRKWSGYYNNALATTNTQTADGWLYTGDIAYFDDEGYLFIVDRKKETMKNAGFQYWPTEIENIIAELPDVLEACVIGIYAESSGDVPGALVRKLPKSLLTEQEVFQYVAERTPPCKHLNAGVVFVEEFPLNKNGKVIKKDAKLLFTRLSRHKQ